MSESKEVVVSKAEQVLGQLLDRALNGIDKAVEFSQAQIPDVIEQLLMWKMIESILWNVAALAIFVVFIAWQWVCFGKPAWVYVDENKDNNLYEGGLGMWFFGSVLLIIVIVIFMNFDWLQIMIAPKLYLLEYAADFVK